MDLSQCPSHTPGEAWEAPKYLGGRHSSRGGFVRQGGFPADQERQFSLGVQREVHRPLPPGRGYNQGTPFPRMPLFAQLLPWGAGPSRPSIPPSLKRGSKGCGPSTLSQASPPPPKQFFLPAAALGQCQTLGGHLGPAVAKGGGVPPAMQIKYKVAFAALCSSILGAGGLGSPLETIRGLAWGAGKIGPVHTTAFCPSWAWRLFHGGFEGGCVARLSPDIPPLGPGASRHLQPSLRRRPLSVRHS